MVDNKIRTALKPNFAGKRSVYIVFNTENVEKPEQPSKEQPFDPDCLLSLQKLFNHTDLQMTMNYIGLTEEKNRQLINDHGEFIHNVLAGKGDEIVKNMPVVSLKSDDFGKIIRMLTDDVDNYFNFWK